MIANRGVPTPSQMLILFRQQWMVRSQYRPLTEYTKTSPPISVEMHLNRVLFSDRWGFLCFLILKLNR